MEGLEGPDVKAARIIHGLRRMSVRGLAGTHKAMLLSAGAYNLKKLLRYHLQQHPSRHKPTPALTSLRCTVWPAQPSN